MKAILTVAAATLCLFLSVSCGGGGADDLTQQAAKATSDFVEVLKGIDSKESAEAAAPALKKVTAAMKSLQEKMAALPQEAQDAMTKEAEASESAQESLKEMMAELGRLATVPGVSEVLEPIMESMSK